MKSTDKIDMAAGAAAAEPVLNMMYSLRDENGVLLEDEYQYVRRFDDKAIVLGLLEDKYDTYWITFSDREKNYNPGLENYEVDEKVNEYKICLLVPLTAIDVETGHGPYLFGTEWEYDDLVKEIIDMLRPSDFRSTYDGFPAIFFHDYAIEDMYEKWIKITKMRALKNINRGRANTTSYLSRLSNNNAAKAASFLTGIESKSLNAQRQEIQKTFRRARRNKKTRKSRK